MIPSPTSNPSTCTNIGECAAVCPKSVPLEVISRLNRDLEKKLQESEDDYDDDDDDDDDDDEYVEQE